MKSKLYVLGVFICLIAQFTLTMDEQYREVIDELIDDCWRATTEPKKTIKMEHYEDEQPCETHSFNPKIIKTEPGITVQADFHQVDHQDDLDLSLHQGSQTHQLMEIEFIKKYPSLFLKQIGTEQVQCQFKNCKQSFPNSYGMAHIQIMHLHRVPYVSSNNQTNACTNKLMSVFGNQVNHNMPIYLCQCGTLYLTEKELHDHIYVTKNHSTMVFRKREVGAIFLHAKQESKRKYQRSKIKRNKSRTVIKLER